MKSASRLTNTVVNITEKMSIFSRSWSFPLELGTLRNTTANTHRLELKGKKMAPYLSYA